MPGRCSSSGAGLGQEALNRLGRACYQEEGWSWGWCSSLVMGGRGKLIARSGTETEGQELTVGKDHGVSSSCTSPGSPTNRCFGISVREILAI